MKLSYSPLWDGRECENLPESIFVRKRLSAQLPSVIMSVVRYLLDKPPQRVAKLCGVASPVR